MPNPNAFSVVAYYDRSLLYARVKHLPEEAPRPLPTCHWSRENIELLERYRDWLLGGGVSVLVTNTYHILMAGHVFGLTLKPHAELDLDKDLDCALEYVKAKQLSAPWIKNCRNALKKFRRFLRLERGLGEESKITPFNSARATEGLPLWLVNELERYQRLLQRNWRDARVEDNIRGFWSGYLKMWRFFVEQRRVQELKDLKRQHVLDYIDLRLGEGHPVSGVNKDLRNLHTFLLFLQGEGYSVPQSLLRIPGLKQPEPLPRYLTDEQVKELREEVERNVQNAILASHRRLALLVRAAFYLLWQGGMRAGEVEELRLEDLDISTSLNAGLGQKRLSVRDGKGRKDHMVYLTETAIHALQEYLAVRGAHSPQNGSGCFAKGSGDHVFLFRNAPLSKNLLRDRLKRAGVSSQTSPYLRHAVTQCGLPRHLHSAVSRTQETLQHHDLCSCT